MATAPSQADAGWLFGLRDDVDHLLQMNMQQNQFQESPEENLSMGTLAAPSTQKKKRTHPDPNAEVIALSPKTLMTTNRFICEVCKKGFQREQNLQLHRRGHNLPWKLKQKSTNDEVKKKVYLCPEPTCVHHHPSRALGDLTGIKKHFYRKHGEKKWKCEKCSKTYAVQSDWRAHSKTCGTKEYRCDCGTLFSRRDSFVTHQAFCDTIGRENSLNLTNSRVDTSQLYGKSRLTDDNQGRPRRQGISFYDHNTQPSNKLLAASSGGDFRSFGSFIPPFNGSAFHPSYSSTVFGSPNYQDNHPSPSKVASVWMMQQFPKNQVPSEHFGQIRESVNGDQGFLAGLISSDNMMRDQISPLYRQASAHLSATELLQKAAQVGSSCIINGSSSLHRSMGSSLSSSRHDLQASLGATSLGALLGDQNSNNLDELMSSLGGSTTSINEKYPTNEEAKPSFREYNTVNIASSDMFTRDFMGVGQIVRHMSGGLYQNDLRTDINKGHQLSSAASIIGYRGLL